MKKVEVWVRIESWNEDFITKVDNMLGVLLKIENIWPGSYPSTYYCLWVYYEPTQFCEYLKLGIHKGEKHSTPV